MGAKNYTESTGRVNYYGVSYGALSTRVKEVPEEYTEIKADELKSLQNKNEDIDLRNKYVVKTGDYPYAVFYKAIEGEIVAINQKQPQGIGKMLELEILDSDGDKSMVSMKLYSKYTEVLLNRLVSLDNITNKNLHLSPYSIPYTFKGKNGETVSMYNQGFSVKVEGVKLEIKYANDDTRLPSTERVMDQDGNEVISRVKRVNFLLEEALSKMVNTTIAKKDDSVSDVMVEEEDDLPF